MLVLGLWARGCLQHRIHANCSARWEAYL